MTYYGIRDEVLDGAVRAGRRALPALRVAWLLLGCGWRLAARLTYWLALTLGAAAFYSALLVGLYLLSGGRGPTEAGPWATFALIGVSFYLTVPLGALAVGAWWLTQQMRPRRPEPLPDLPVPAVQDTYQPVVTARGALTWLPEGRTAAAEEVLALIDPPPAPRAVAVPVTLAAASTGWGAYTRTGTITAFPTPIREDPDLGPIECPRCGRAALRLPDGTCVPHTVPGQPTKVCWETGRPTPDPEDPR